METTDADVNFTALGITDQEFDHYVGIDDSVECYGELTDEQIIEDLQDTAVVSADTEETEEVDYPVPTTSEVIVALGTVRKYSDAKGLTETLDKFYSIEDQLWKVVAQSTHQTSITDFFRPAF